MSSPKEQLFDTRSKDAWKRIGIHRRAGVQLSLFSVYSKKSQGIGDLFDLKLVIDWCVKTGMSIIQLLPMNEVGALFCPYDSLSSFALEPMYLSLNEIRTPSGKGFDRSVIRSFAERFPLTRGYVNYALKEAKLEVLWDFYCRQVKQEDEEFKAYRQEQEYWLRDCALYKVLKRYHGQAAWYDWADPYKNRDVCALAEFEKEHKQEIAFQMWLQWQLFNQMKSVTLYAAGKKVLLKGDLPILVSRDSADVWAHPEFFKLDFAAGAPPDMYCSKGQRWGMPTYQWDRIAADGYRYVKEKLRYAQNFYDIGRIDHVVGLFRIWSIPFSDPEENKGLHGFYDPPDQSLWGPQGRHLLQIMLQSTMLLCAEDLGTIPQVCKDALKEFGIPGNDVQRWVKDWDVAHDFRLPADYRYLSVAMLATHDTTNWAAWWEYEAGTVDEDLLVRICCARGIDFGSIRQRLFDAALSRYGRLRWLASVDSVEKAVSVLGRGREELYDFINMYLNSYGEKEKLWKLFGLSGRMREKCDGEIIRAALRYTLNSNAIFSIESVIDWLYLAGAFDGDPYQYRINSPGDVSEKNWSLCMPLALDDMIEHPVNADIRRMIRAAGRAL